MSFLKAEWRKLIMANYEIDPKLLADFVPNHTELDLWNGRCYLSLVGFKFVNTRMLGLKIPFHIHFPEVNLRFYVKHKSGNEWKRGVVFIKEIVPKPAITIVANTLYKEKYQTLRMRDEWVENNEFNELSVKYEWKYKGDWQRMSVKAFNVPQPIPKLSETEFITEHYWGYTKINDLNTYEYEVTHPTWQAYEVNQYEIKVDFGKVYGKRFCFLNKIQPTSVMFAEGSEITVETMKKI
jgi:uncharacterized protein